MTAGAVRMTAGALLVLALAGCRGETPRAAPLFEMLAPERTGVAFVNTLTEDSTFNLLTYLYYYNGGGVAVGDIDNDGFPDLYFTSNLGSNRLYRNKGNYEFEDITEKAGVGDSVGWKTGVTMADVNGDGRVDIYVSGVNYATMGGRNVLYVNNGDGTFTDRTKEFGLDFVGYSTQALFFDYDGDGDLDMFLLNNSTHADQLAFARDRRVRHPRAGDRLYRNDGGHFSDVSEHAGIYGGVEGFGLGVVASDLNGDGCPDLYVSNDFQENDFLYLNNCDGTFTESIGRATGHTSQFSMGVDAADFNNDGRPDIVTVDMLPERESILKTAASAESFALYNLKLQAGYHPQFARNTLQLNRGAAPVRIGVDAINPPRTAAPSPLFSDIGYFAGMAATDWSWAPLFADLDNDGRKDLFITDGIYRRPNDLDYINFIGNAEVQTALARGDGAARLSLLQRMPHVPLPNHAFRNDGGLRFTNMAAAWGLDDAGFSNGAAYVDLNNSGALDLVINRINAPAAIYRNRARERNANHFLRVRLRGAAKASNTEGIGATVILARGDSMQLLEQMPTRGFQSSVDTRLHFGLGASARIDSLTVIWPDRRSQTLTGVAADREVTLFQDSANAQNRPARAASTPLFADVTGAVGLDFRHHENEFFDYNREPLIPRLLSTEGPALAVGDVNGDSLDDVFVGGARGQSGALFLQQPNGRFQRAALSDRAFSADSVAEDVDAAFFDADGDGDLDLYVVSGGNEFSGEDDALQDRLYINDGHGVFVRKKDALPRMSESGSHVAVADFSGDGRPDVFVGRRAVSRKYGIAPRSYLLQNDGTGRFLDVTAEKAPALAHVGMVTSAAWLRSGPAVTGSGLDLVVVGEWMPIRVFHQESRGGRFVERTAQAGLSGTTGWWSSVTTADVNGDGRPDLILGNLGLNSYIRASQEHPVRLYVGDFARSGGVQQILTFYKDSVSYPLAGRDEIVRQVPALQSRYPSYASFGASRVEDIIPAADLRAATTLEARTLASAVALNNGNEKGTFELRALPTEAQLAPIYGSLVYDVDGDGRQDLLVGGNFFGVPPVIGRYDASYGLLMRGDGAGGFAPMDMQQSGIAIGGQVRALRTARTARGGRLIIVARNNDGLQVLRPTH